jgi:MFS family permease
LKRIVSEQAPNQLAEQLADELIAAQTSPARARLELLVVGLATLFVASSQSLVVPLLASLPERLHTSSTNVEWLLTASLLACLVTIPLFGRLGDMFGKRMMMMVSIGMLILGSVIAAMSNNIGLLILGRAIQGSSLAAVSLGISLLSTLLPPERARPAIALVSATLGVGNALALPFAGVVAEHADFHVLFWITAAGGLLILIATAVVVPESSTRTGGRVDVRGALLFTAALLALLLPLAQGSSWGWSSPLTLGLLIASAPLTVAFVRFELRVVDPLVNIVATARPAILYTNIASLLYGFALFASLIGTASYVQAPKGSGYGFGSSIVVAGVCLLPSAAVMLLLAPITARLMLWWGANRALAFGAGLVVVGYLERIVLSGSLWEIILGSTVVGAGNGIGYAAMPTLINRNTPREMLAAANGLNSMSRGLGASLASAVGGSVLAASTVAVGGAVFASHLAYQLLFAVCGLAGVLAAVLALAIPDRGLEPEAAA